MGNLHVDEATFDLLLGSILPPLIAIIQQPKWPNLIKATVTVLLCVAAGAIRSYLNGQLLPHDLITTSIRIIIAAQATYEAFWKHAGAKVIEAITSNDPMTDVTEDTP